VGVKLPGLEFQNQRVEAAFRKELVYGEDDAGRAGPAQFAALFADVRRNYFRLFFHYMYFDVAKWSYLQFGMLVPYVALGRILREAAARTRCAHFGLLAGRVWHLSDLGVVGQLVRNTPTVGEALHKLNVHQHLNCEGAVPFLRETAGVADFGIAIYDAGVTGLEQLFDAYIATNMNFARELCGPTWTPTAVFIPSAKPHDFTHHRHFLNVSPTFNAEFCAIRFSAHWLRKAVNGADPALLQLAESQVSCDKVPSIVQQASRALRILFLDSKYSGDDVAQALSMHRRTLNRRLHDEGTTFQAVLDDVRFELARQLISSSHIALDDVAASLGYAGASPFTRRFTRSCASSSACAETFSNFSISCCCAAKARTTRMPPRFSSITRDITVRRSCSSSHVARNFSCAFDEFQPMNGTKLRLSRPSSQSVEISR